MVANVRNIYRFNILAVIIAWSISYTYFAITGAWGKDTQSFLFKEYLQVADKPGQFGGLVPEVLIPLALVWIIVLGVAFKGVKKESKLLTVFSSLY